MANIKDMDSNEFVYEFAKVCAQIVFDDYAHSPNADAIHRRFHELENDIADRVDNGKVEHYQTIGEMFEEFVMAASDYLGDRGHCPLGLLE